MPITSIRSRPSLDGPFISTIRSQGVTETDWNSYIARYTCTGGTFTVENSTTATELVLSSGPVTDVSEVVEGLNIIYKLPNDDTVYRGTLGPVSTSTPTPSDTTADISSFGLSSVPEQVMKDNLPIISVGAEKDSADLRLQDYTFQDSDIIFTSNTASLVTKPTGNPVFSSGEQFVPYEETGPADIDSIAYDNLSFSVSSTGQPQDIAIKPDGTVLIVIFGSADVAKQYNLSTPFDLSTASDSGNTLALAEASFRDGTGIVVSDDGTRIITSIKDSGTGGLLTQYNMSSPWDLSTATYSGIAFNPDSNSLATRGLGVNNDGTKLYLASDNSGSEKVDQFTLSTAWDLSTISYESTLSVSSETSNLSDVSFNSTGTRMFLLVFNSRATLLQYSLSTPYDVTSATFDNISVDLSSVDNFSRGFSAGSNGTTFYYVAADQSQIYQFSTPTSVNGAFEIVERDSSPLLSAIDSPYVDSITYDNASFNLSVQDSSPTAIAFNDDGTKFYMHGTGNDTIYQYSLSTAYDVTTLAYDSVSISLGNEDFQTNGIEFGDSGRRLYFIGASDNEINQYNLGTPYDLATASYQTREFVGDQASSPRSVRFAGDGTKFFVLDASTDTIYEYELPSPFANIDGSTYTGNSYILPSELTNPEDFVFKDNGNSMLILDGNQDSVFQFGMSSPYNISSLVYIQNLIDVGTQESAPRGIVFNADETKIFIIGPGSDSVYQYSIAETEIIAFNFNNLGYAPVQIDIPNTATRLDNPASELWTGNNIERISRQQFTPLGSRHLQFRFDGDPDAEVFQVQYNLTKFRPGFLPVEPSASETIVVTNFENETDINQGISQI
jgi:sugar lactone lactonase YvrE